LKFLFLISLYLGGEKLKMSRLLALYIWMFLVFITGSGGGGIYLSAQSLDEEARSPDPRAAERLIILGEAPPVEAVPFQERASPFTVLRMVLVLALAALAVYGVVFFLKRLGRPAEQRDPYLKVLASVHLGANRFAYVLSVGSRAWLVGAAESGVSLIAEISDQETVDAMRLDDSRKSAETGSRFLDFKTMLRRLGGGGFPENSTGPGADNLRKRRERLRGL
jgi:flagellar protein FliO/FliZ